MIPRNGNLMKSEQCHSLSWEVRKKSFNVTLSNHWKNCPNAERTESPTPLIGGQAAMLLVYIKLRYTNINSRVQTKPG